MKKWKILNNIKNGIYIFFLFEIKLLFEEFKKVKIKTNMATKISKKVKWRILRKIEKMGFMQF